MTFTLICCADDGSTPVIVWDEVPMQHRFGPEAISRTLADIRDDTRPFGGLTVVFGGDFRQILPVVRRGRPEHIIGASLCRSSLWKGTQILRLHRNQRLEPTHNSSRFASWLLKIGSGELGKDDSITLPPSMVVTSADELLDFVYPGINGTLPSYDFFKDRAILAARNGDVTRINHDVLKMLAGREMVLFSADAVVMESGADGSNPRYPVEVLRSLDAAGLPPGELHVKIGCPLILLVNLAPSRGLCNGTRMVLRRASDRVLEVSILGGSHNGSIALIPRVSLTPNSDSDFPFVLRRRQFPVRLAFAMSINKSQGQSLKVVGLDLRVPIFTHGQLYVALSRATSGDRIRALLPPDSRGETSNIVFPQVLLD